MTKNNIRCYVFSSLLYIIAVTILCELLPSPVLIPNLVRLARLPFTNLQEPIDEKTHVTLALNRAINARAIGWDHMLIDQVFNVTAISGPECVSTYYLEFRLHSSRPPTCNCLQRDQYVTGNLQYFAHTCPASKLISAMDLEDHYSKYPVADPQKTIFFVVTTSESHIEQLDFLLEEFREVYKQDPHIHVTITEFVDKGATHQTETKSHSHKSFEHVPNEWVLMEGEFSRVLGLRKAVDTVRTISRDKDPLIFLMDSTLTIPPNLLANVRSQTIPGVAAFAPTCEKMFEEHKRTNYWGYGIISTYLSDYDSVGGLNISRARGWGQEDTDLVQSFLEKRLKVVRLPVRNYKYSRVIEKDESKRYYVQKNPRDKPFPVTPDSYELTVGSNEWFAVQTAIRLKHSGSRWSTKTAPPAINQMLVTFSGAGTPGYYSVLWRFPKRTAQWFRSYIQSDMLYVDLTELKRKDIIQSIA